MPRKVLLGRILAPLALAGALVAAAIAVRLGDAWNIGIGVLGVFGTAMSNVVVWRARGE
ncbi:hypothetical protein ACH4FX_08605 [Streptomyces sp. NPDC018019]|uniref:hypothetical protein n=1 Tax=Streptomyces sp. NPDC018019 TaxID=3365030 RepID=UPI0037AB8D59